MKDVDEQLNTVALHDSDGNLYLAPRLPDGEPGPTQAMEFELIRHRSAKA